MRTHTLLVALVLYIICAISAGASAQSWKFVVVGDTRGDVNGVNTTIVGELANATVAEGAEFILVPGDLVNSGNLSSFNTWKSTMAPVYNAGIGVYPIRGNHDLPNPADWVTAFGADIPDNGPAGEVDLTYSFTRHNALIVGFDEYVNGHRINQTWLDAQFAANTQPHVFTFGHEPAFKVNHADCLDDYATNRNTFWGSLLAEGGRTYFCGHDHLFNLTRLDNADGNTANDAYQVVIGNGGAPSYTSYAYDGNNAPFTPTLVNHDEAAGSAGYMVVEVNGLDVTMTYKHRTSPGTYVAYGATVSYTAVPEPTALGLLSLLALGLRRRSR